VAVASSPVDLVTDGSFEQPMARNQFGWVFRHWSGWKYEGECEFRVGHVARHGATSCLLFGSSQPKIRVWQTLKGVPPGRYRITAYLRGLDISVGPWDMDTEFAFDGKYYPLRRRGTFDWTQLTCVVDVLQRKDIDGPSFGLLAPGYLWIDDVSMMPVGAEVPLTREPQWSPGRPSIDPPEPVGPRPVACAECGYRNRASWPACYVCGAPLGGAKAVGPAVRGLTSFEHGSPFEGGHVVAEHVTDGEHALRLDRGYAAWEAAQDWSGYDYLQVDLSTDADRPVPLDVEIRDRQTADYWTRFNYETVVPPGRSTLVLPLGQMYVGEKARPGRKLAIDGITRLVFNIHDRPPGAVDFDHLRLERDTQTPRMRFDDLHAFDFGPAGSPLMPGFTRVTPTTLYSPGRGYGLNDARVWRACDALQPDPLYQDFLCIEKGGLRVDVPNGRYRVWMNLDNPSGFWGEYQVYRRRVVLAQHRVVVDETMDFASAQAKYFRYWNIDDDPDENTFDKYQRQYYQEQQFDVDVTDGHLTLDFRGENFACSVAAVVVFPVAQAAQGQRFLEHVVGLRKFFFENYFHRILPQPGGDPIVLRSGDLERGYQVFTRDWMEDVYPNDRPRQEELDAPLTASAVAGELEPMTVAVCPLADLGQVAVTTSDLKGPATIPAQNIDVGYVSYRLSRVSMGGAVYTLAPRVVLPSATVNVRMGVTRRFWLTVRTPPDARPGLYRGTITLHPEHGRTAQVPIEFRVYAGRLDPLDVPAGPWGHEIRSPWPAADPQAQAWNRQLAERSLRKLHAYGFTTFSGLPRLEYLGFRDGRPRIDFREGDRQMELARRCGFTMPVVSYVELPGLNLYYRDEEAMQTAGFRDYPQFVRAIFAEIERHARSADWLPIRWNLGDEPVGDDLVRAAENAEAYRAAFPVGPPWFTAATSFTSARADDPHFRFARALHVANLSDHNEPSVRRLQEAGTGWAFYNNGNRWTYGEYLFRAVRQFGAQFRLAWHWNASAGDPYYALDCREDDYAWCHTNAQGQLIPSVEFERLREGIDDYRYLLTVSRLAHERRLTAIEQRIAARLARIRLGQLDHHALYPAADWRAFRRELAEALEQAWTRP
jgi:hypothetical protein